MTSEAVSMIDVLLKSLLRDILNHLPIHVFDLQEQEDDLGYAALRHLKGNRTRRQPSEVVSHCVYTSVRQ